MLTFLLQDDSFNERRARADVASVDGRADWWRFEQRGHHDPTHPAAGWTVHLLQEAASTRLPCPRCGVVAPVATNLDHLLRHHRAGYDEAAAWLEDADPDLFSLAVHYLATKARAGRVDRDGLRLTPPAPAPSGG